MISSTSNPRIKNLKKLMTNARYRREKGCFPVEGPRMFFEIPKDRILEVYVTEAFKERYRETLTGYPCEVIEDRIMRSLSDTKTPQGVMAMVRRQETSLTDLLNKDKPQAFLLLENLQDPGNLGTMLRTAEAAGMTGVIVDRRSVDPYNTKVIRSSMGAILRLPLLECDDLGPVCRQMKEAGIRIFAGHLDGESLYQSDFRVSCAFLIGNEGQGLSPEIMAQADQGIRIPMKGKVESLNAAMAATILMYELLRQREWAGDGGRLL